MKLNRVNSAQITEDQSAGLLVIIAALIGLLLRLALPLTSSFPLNDGGLFYNMIRDLQANGYGLPAFTTYNHAQIPFAYPPLAFYLAGALSSLANLDLLDILRLLPPIVSAGSIPVFYLVAKEFLPSKTSAALASLLFALTPRVFAWMIMGGGITRSFGFLFALLTIYSARRLYATHAARFIFWTPVWAALTILTHPEAIPQTALAALILFLFTDRSRKGFLQSLAAAALTIILTAPWWTGILQTHGLDPFLAASSAVAQDSNGFPWRIFFLFQFIFTEEPFLPLIGLLALLGIFYNLAHRQYFLPIWAALPYLLEPRGGTLYIMIPLTMLAAQGLGNIILPGLIDKTTEDSAPTDLPIGRGTKSFLVFLTIYLVIAGYVTCFKIYDRVTLTPDQARAMDWIRENTPADAGFVIISGGQPLLDPASDWFPALTGRKSLATVFGYEWLNDGRFMERIRLYDSLQACAGQTSACLEKWGRENNLEFNYIYIQQDRPTTLEASLADSDGCTIEYRDKNIVVFECTVK